MSFLPLKSTPVQCRNSIFHLSFHDLKSKPKKKKKSDEQNEKGQ